eukprot:CAMPEP_0117438976 /NCGR_PEP_ID=MMETSP0759-20121206/2332_1 /TAXON_ID=63605 /ORGANISM="Percolomonas cosmopolitus, Strain WS" /LENGTH=619 /DNA_ID=CAMNT_0005230687 /DNA_START=195 /DNA_END=2054 /DNA_ORIENTATION=-
MARKWKFIDDSASKRLQRPNDRNYLGTSSKFHSKQKELMRIEQEILNQSEGINTLSDSLRWTGGIRKELNGQWEMPEEVQLDSQEESNLLQSSNATSPSHQITITDSSPSPFKRNHFAPSQPSQLTTTYSPTTSPSVSKPGSTLTPGSPGAAPHSPKSKSSARRRRGGSSIASKKSSKSPASPLQQIVDPFDDAPRLEFTGLKDLGGEFDDDTALFIAPPAPTKVVAIPKFKTLHPLSQIEECVDFPVELRIENYEEDATFAKYRKRLTEDFDSKVHTKKKERLRRIDGYGTWYVPPTKWNEHMKTMREKQRAARERRGEDDSDEYASGESRSPTAHGAALDASGPGSNTQSATNNGIPLNTTAVIATETSQYSSSSQNRKSASASSPVHVELPPTIQVVKSHLPPLDEDKQQQLEKLHSSRRFKEYLIKTHSSIPEWLSKVSVSEAIVEEARLGPLDNTAIPQALRRVNYSTPGNEQYPASLGKIQKKKGSHSITGMENGVAEYSGVTIQGPSGGIKKETPMQRNKNDLRYISQFMKRINNAENMGSNSGKSTKRRRPHHDPLLPELNPLEEQHPDPDSRPRRSIPLSTIIRLTTERRKKVEEERMKSLDQTTLQFSS